jgi:hypothetical protein
MNHVVVQIGDTPHKKTITEAGTGRVPLHAMDDLKCPNSHFIKIGTETEGEGLAGMAEVVNNTLKILTITNRLVYATSGSIRVLRCLPWWPELARGGA